MASHRAYLPFVSSPVARKRYTSPTTAMVRPWAGLRTTGVEGSLIGFVLRFRSDRSRRDGYGSRSFQEEASPQDRGRQAISQRWGHLHRQTPAFGLRSRRCTVPQPAHVASQFADSWAVIGHGGPACRVAHVLERQRRAGLALAAVAGQAPRPPVEVDGLLAGRAGRPPVAGLHDRLARGLAGPGRCPQPDGDGLPARAVPGGGAGDGVGDLVPERVEDRLLGAVPGVILGDLDPLRPVLADAQPPLRPARGRRSSRAGRALQALGRRSPSASRRPSPALRGRQWFGRPAPGWYRPPRPMSRGERLPRAGSTHEDRQATCNAARQPGHLPEEDFAP